MRQYFPRKHLDILLNVAGFWVREAHDDLEELLAIWLGLGNRQRAESLEVAADSVLFLYREANIDQLLQQVNRIHAGNEAFVLVFPPDTTDTYAARCSSFWGDGRKGCRYGTAMLRPLEFYEPPLGVRLLLRPVLAHLVQVAINLKYRFCLVHGIGVEWLRRRDTAALRKCSCSHQHGSG